MLKDKAIEYYQRGYNCSQCIIKACEEEFDLKIASDCYKSLDGVYNGFGIGSTCCVLIACIMIIGIVGDDVAYKRLKMTEGFKKKLGTTECCIIKNEAGCERIITSACEVLSSVLKAE